MEMESDLFCIFQIGTGFPLALVGGTDEINNFLTPHNQDIYLFFNTMLWTFSSTPIVMNIYIYMYMCKGGRLQ